jgi:hypothetical protein
MLSRGILGLLGAGIIVYVLTVDPRRSVGIEPGSPGQLVFIAIGILLILSAVLWHRLRFEHVSRTTETIAVGLLSVGLLLVVTELLVIVSFNLQFVSGDYQRTPSGDDLELYTTADSDWRADYREDYQQVGNAIDYSPYDLWTRRPYQGTAITINADGSRRTVGSVCTPDAYRIYVYGGSTLWGFEVTDAMTIPSYLQAELDAVIDQPVCVVNYADLAMVNTQEIMRLMTQLQADDVPDMVIFYDGVNDVIAANRNGPGTHRLGNLYEGFFRSDDGDPIADWWNGTYISLFTRNLAGGGGGTPDEPSPTSGPDRPLADRTVDLYLTNYEIVAAWAEAFDFDYLFFWQPVLVASDKPRTEQEVLLVQAPPESLVTLYQDVYAIMDDIAGDYPNLINLSGIFDDVETMLFIDFNHVSYQGNQIIAGHMAEVVIDRLNGGDDATDR